MPDFRPINDINHLLHDPYRDLKRTVYCRSVFASSGSRLDGKHLRSPDLRADEKMNTESDVDVSAIQCSFVNPESIYKEQSQRVREATWFSSVRFAALSSSPFDNMSQISIAIFASTAAPTKNFFG